MGEKKQRKLGDSEIEWIEMKPIHWKRWKLKYLTQEPLKYGANEVGVQDQPEMPRYIRITDIGEYGVLKEDDPKYLPIEKANDYILKDGDILFARSGATVGKSFIFKDIMGLACYAGYLIRFRANIKRIIPQFLYFYSESYEYSLWISRSIIQATIQNVSGEKYSNLKISIPFIEEQKLIVNFLEKKTSQIDNLIENIQHQIEKLKEYRQAIISEAVTKGLDPAVPMRDSGIEWIGMIPEHWEIKKLKFIDEIIMGQSPDSQDYNDICEGPPFLQGNAEFGSIHPNADKYCATANKLCRENDILLSVRAPIGAVNLADQVYGIGRGLCAIRANKSYYKYLYYLAINLNDELNKLGKGTTFIAIVVDDVKNIYLPIPSFNEQTQISNYLDDKTSQIDNLIQNIQNQIEKLKEYRQTIISEAVTGKIEIGE